MSRLGNACRSLRWAPAEGQAYDSLFFIIEGRQPCERFTVKVDTALGARLQGGSALMQTHQLYNYAQSNCSQLHTTSPDAGQLAELHA
jgi:hypothetical protein